MKNLALLRYQIMFDPSESWSNGYQFENQLADFFAAHGFEAQIIAPSGGTGDRVIWLERVFIPSKESKPEVKSNTVKQIKQVQQKTPPKDFKQFKNPKHFVAAPPKTTYQQGRTNRKKVRVY